ncbi:MULTISPECIES: hypothetical protein [unclassified Endozoicomonas]|uniref:hypothetical protein n=1 Tax=unclassified Endozoicomonas TaxID=2644528 RepID=UPI003BB7A0F0
MWNGDLPIGDWSYDGRKHYVDSYRDRIELVIEAAFETFDAEKISTVFSSQKAGVEQIITRFLVPDLDPEKLPCRDIRLFSEIGFWIEHKTRGRVSSRTKTHGRHELTEQVGRESFEVEVENALDQLAHGLRRLNSHVASDLVYYWLLANKKLLDEIGCLEKWYEIAQEPEQKGSATKATRYKADACFRYLYLFFEMGKRIDDREAACSYERKYLVKGENKPQYTSPGVEEHSEKAKVRRVIRKIIDQFLSIKPKLTPLQQCLYKAMAKKSLVDLYEFEEVYREEYRNKITLLKLYKSSEESVA